MAGRPAGRPDEINRGRSDFAFSASLYIAVGFLVRTETPRGLRRATPLLKSQVCSRSAAAATIIGRRHQLQFDAI
jgi:hypothetical protein